MTQFGQKSFVVKTGVRTFATCGHGWVNSKNVCVFCGGKVCYECGGDGYVVMIMKYDDIRSDYREQCPNSLCDRGFIP